METGRLDPRGDGLSRALGASLVRFFPAGRLSPPSPVSPKRAAAFSSRPSISRARPLGSKGSLLAKAFPRQGSGAPWLQSAATADKTCGPNQLLGLWKQVFGTRQQDGAREVEYGGPKKGCAAAGSSDRIIGQRTSAGPLKPTAHIQRAQTAYAGGLRKWRGL
jgi:hypothetical protein